MNFLVLGYNPPPAAAQFAVGILKNKVHWFGDARVSNCIIIYIEYIQPTCDYRVDYRNI